MVDLLVTYLEMTQRPDGAPFPQPTARARIERQHIRPSDYLTLYRRVGEPLQWDQRLRMPAEALEALLRDDGFHVYVLRFDGQAAGFCEFVAVGQPDVELTHFGLAPEFQGRKLGPYLLDHSLRAIWALAPKRIWLHTDTNDHPHAQEAYQRAGFRPYMQRMEKFED